MIGFSFVWFEKKAILSLFYALALVFISFFLTAPARANDLKSFLEKAAANSPDLIRFYEARGYEPIWTGRGDRKRRNALISALETAGIHGLPVSRYRPNQLIARLRAARSDADQAQIEVALSETYLRYAKDVNTGILRPTDLLDDILRKVPKVDSQVFLNLIAQSEPVAALAAISPRMPQYVGLMKEKLRIEADIAKGGWGAKVPMGTLTVRSSGPQVVPLRNRLTKMGYLERTATQDYAGKIEFAVKSFQRNHGLLDDGVAASVTLSEINMSPQTRLISVVVALERLRWMNYELGTRHIWVNLPDFTAKVIDNDKSTFETRTVIGANVDGQRSPEFSENMRYLSVNPSWNVPKSITIAEYLPQLQKNANAVDFLQLISDDGEVVPRETLDFTLYTPETFPFRLRQLPSDDNALGTVKFMFPNPQNIYLHDTPQKALFAKESRAFSHGCIRLAQPHEMAHVLLERQSGDPVALFDAALANAPNEEIINLAQSVPVHLVYFTSFVDEEGHIQYRRDVYSRDKVVFDALIEKGLDFSAFNG